MSRSKPASSLPAAQLDNYFTELSRCGGVAPAARYRLEGYLQCLLETKQIAAAELSSEIKARIDTFNRGGQVALPTPAKAWQLPYAAPIAPVNQTSKE
ncbi:MAG: hypothetical protein HKO07_04720 [Pseudomonadales bacterium]|nr:hypothetical protein [Pseudomonadales bacterium]